MTRRLKQLLTSAALRRAPLATGARAARLGLDVLTRRGQRIIHVPLYGAGFDFLTFPGSARTGSRGISVLGPYYEPLLYRAADYVSPGDVVIDGGANTGIFSCAFGMLGASVHAFEPLAETREHLVRNIALNKLEHRTRIVPVALGGEDGRVKMSVANGPVSASIVHSLDRPGTEVEVMTLDTYLETAGTGRISFIKLDIEGAETAALRGAARLLVRDRPALCLEIWQEAELSEVMGMLDPLGYRFAELTFDGERPLPLPFRPIANLLALPDDGTPART